MYSNHIIYNVYICNKHIHVLRPRQRNGSAPGKKEFRRRRRLTTTPTTPTTPTTTTIYDYYTTTIRLLDDDYYYYSYSSSSCSCCCCCCYTIRLLRVLRLYYDYYDYYDYYNYYNYYGYLYAGHGACSVLAGGLRVILELTLIVGSAGLLDLRCHRRVGLKAIEWGPAASEIYSLCFFEHLWKSFCVCKSFSV